MKRLAALMFVLGSLAVGCTGRGAVSPPPPSPSVAPSTVLRIVKPQNVTVRQEGSLFVTEPAGRDASDDLWAGSVVRSAGAVCSDLKPPGIQYTVSDASDSGLTMAITCEADGSNHTVRIVFIPESG
jgi:hypothetical protein